MTGQHYNSGKASDTSFRVERPELNIILNLMREGQSVLVMGGRKIGKTVLLEQLRTRFELDRGTSPIAVPVYQDLMSLTRPPTAARLFGALSYKVPLAINTMLEQRGIRGECQLAPDAWRYDPSVEFIQYITNVLDDLDDTVGRVILVYLLDECEALLGTEETHTLLGNLRALIGPETDNRVRIVVTGFRDIHEYEDPLTGTSPFKNVLLPLPLGLLEDAAFEELVQPLLESLPSEKRETMRHQVWRATGGHPCITQVICHLLTTRYLVDRFEASCTEATSILHHMAFAPWMNKFNREDHYFFQKVLNDEHPALSKPSSLEFLQYCGVLTVRDGRFLAPCGLFNLWYKQSIEMAADSLNIEPTAIPDGERVSITGMREGNPEPISLTACSTLQVNNTRALVMKGGGVKGLAYVGALKELEKYYAFNWFIGTSAGAIAAVLLAAGFSTDELRNILIEKNYIDFLDSRPHKWPTNLLFQKGLFPARTFTAWIDQLLARKLQTPVRVTLGQLPSRATVYASRRGKSALVFDSQDPRTKDTPAAYAVRCSMSIPFIFTPQMDAGVRVLDGGVRNNYPVEILLRDHPGTEFIGLYLGPEFFEGEPRERWLIHDLFSIWTEASDIDSLASHIHNTVIIDPRPVTTIDFMLSREEKDFLIKIGRASALKYLSKYQSAETAPIQDDVTNALKEAGQAHERASVVRSTRKKKFAGFLAICAVIIVLILMAYMLWL